MANLRKVIPISVGLALYVILCGSVPLVFKYLGFSTDRQGVKTPEEPITHMPSRMTRSPRMAHYERVHWYAKHRLPVAVELERHFGDADHLITHFGFDDKTNIWNTVVFFGERYTLTMQVEIRIDYRSETFETVGPMQFSLVGIDEAQSDGSASIKSQDVFGEQEWDKLKSNNWDFSSIGVKIDETAAPGYAQHIAGWRAPRYPIKLLTSADE